MSRVRVYLASSVDGYIAGPDHEIDWLNEDHGTPSSPPAAEDVLGFHDFMAQVGCMLMGRNTYDLLVRLDADWHYGDTPVHVTTRRPLEKVLADTVRPVAGDIETLIAEAKEIAGSRDVYLDGGDLVRQGLDAGLVDELTITWIPVLLGAGIPLFQGLQNRFDLAFTAHRDHCGGLLQVTMQKRS